MVVIQYLSSLMNICLMYMPPKKSYDLSFKIQALDEMRHLFKSGVYILSVPQLRRLNEGGIYLRAAFNQRNTVAIVIVTARWLTAYCILGNK